MKTILHYINWALYDFNRVCIYILKNYLKFGLALLAMLLVSIPILFFTDSEWAIGIYGIFLLFGSLFIAITWMIKHEKPETEEVTDQFGMTHTLTEEFEPKDWKQSAVSSGKWVLYTISLFVGAAIIVSFL